MAEPLAARSAAADSKRAISVTVFASHAKLQLGSVLHVAPDAKLGAIPWWTVAAEPETDFSTMSETEAVAVAKQAQRDAATARNVHLAKLGRACARLHAIGWTWDRIGAEMGVNLTTAYRWARPYIAD